MPNDTVPFAKSVESIEVRLNGEVVKLDLKSYAGRYAARAAAYALLLEGKENEAALILDAVGREG